MRRLWMIPAMLAVLGWALGCGGSQTDQTATKEEAGDHPETAAAENATPAAQDVQTEDAAELASVVMDGKIGCGHCTFHIGDTCSLAMEAEDGTVYLLEAGDQQAELMDVRYDRPMAKVTGRVADVDGQKVIHTDSVELF